MKARILCTALLAAASAGSDAVAGVRVTYGDPDRFIDAGDRSNDPVKVAKALAMHLEGLGSRLPAGTDVAIEILDVDRAGRPRMNLPTGIRVMNGRADMPCIELGYTVSRQGQQEPARRERVCDPDYLDFAHPPSATGDPLVYEKRMLDDWFERRFGQGR